MKKVCVVGHFGFGQNLLNGQTVKTKILTSELEKKIGTQQVLKVDTHGGIRMLVKLVFQSFGLLCRCERIIMLPAHNGVRVLLPMFVLINFLFRKKISYVVIGGWIAQMTDKNRWLMFFLKRLEGIYVETSFMKQELEQRGLSNVRVLPNPKNLVPLSEDEIPACSEPMALCTFSRVIEQKGIEEAIQAVKQMNQNQRVATLDICGPIEDEYQERFSALQAEFPDYIRYCGAIPSEQSVSVLKKYDLHLFPTKFLTEGIPGSIIDGYYAGLPVLASKWESFADVVVDGVTGVGYQFGDYDDFFRQLQTLVANPETVFKMKQNSLKRAKQYQQECEVKIREYFL